MLLLRPARCVPLLIALLASPCPAPAQAPEVTLRDPEFEVIVEQNVMIPMRDGVRLAADIYRPARDDEPAEGRFPTLLSRTPYNKEGGAAEARYYAQRGYAVVLNDVRGQFASEGTWHMMTDDPEDGYDVVEWIAAQDWSDGKIGTFGTSYVGGTQHALAEMNPPHLTTMVPVDALSNTAVAGMRHGGAFELRFLNWAFFMSPRTRQARANPALREALDEQARRIRQHADLLPLSAGNSPLRVVPDLESWIVKALRSGPEDPMWHARGMSVIDHVDDYADVPVLHITGWYDSWTRQVAMSYEALSKAKQSPQRLVIGPWVHGAQRSNVSGEVEFSDDAAVDLNAFRLRWYDHWMRGEDNGVDDDQPVLIYVMGTGDDRRSPEGRLLHGGFWRAEPAWPLERAKPRRLYLHAGGTLAQEKPSIEASRTTYRFDPARPVPTVGGNISSNNNLMAHGGYDQRPREDTHAADTLAFLAQRPDVLVFRTEPLKEAIEVTGTVEVKLWVASTALDTDFTAKLVEEIPPNPDYPLGFDLNIGDSVLRLRYREGLDRQVPYTPGEVVPITITLYPTSNVFKAGHRIRIDISSSNYPRFDVNPNTGEPLGTSRRKLPADNTIVHDADHPSHVLLPVVPDRLPNASTTNTPGEPEA